MEKRGLLPSDAIQNPFRGIILNCNHLPASLAKQTIYSCNKLSASSSSSSTSCSSSIQLRKARSPTVISTVHSRKVESAAANRKVEFGILALGFQKAEHIFGDALKLKTGAPAVLLKNRLKLSWLFVALLITGSCFFPASMVAEAFASSSSSSVTSLPEYRSPYDPVSEPEREASKLLSIKVEEAVNLLEKGRQAQAEGDYREAVNCYGQIKEKAGDLAIAEYARVGHAISLYEVGDRTEAILEMEDVSVTLKGYPEVHAALAAALYVDKNATISAERQFALATLLDPRYLDLSFVKECKYWPPSLVSSLNKFLSLT